MTIGMARTILKAVSAKAGRTSAQKALLAKNGGSQAAFRKARKTISLGMKKDWDKGIKRKRRMNKKMLDAVGLGYKKKVLYPDT